MMPTVHLPHGGGPWPFVDMGSRDQAGAAGQDRGAVAYSGVFQGWTAFAFQFGA